MFHFNHFNFNVLNLEKVYNFTRKPWDCTKSEEKKRKTEVLFLFILATVMVILHWN